MLLLQDSLIFVYLKKLGQFQIVWKKLLLKW